MAVLRFGGAEKQRIVSGLAFGCTVAPRSAGPSNRRTTEPQNRDALARCGFKLSEESHGALPLGGREWLIPEAYPFV